MKQFNVEEYLKNSSRKVVTRDGRNVKIHCTDYTASSLIVAKIEGEDHSHSFYRDGSYLGSEESPRDLFFATEKHEGWVNVYKGGDRNYFTLGAMIYDRKEDAERCRIEETCVATVKIEWEDE